MERAQEELNWHTDTPVQVVQLGDARFHIEAKGPFSEKDAAGYVPNPESEQLRFHLPNFEGPLDLLLYLIQKHSMDIFDIPIALVTEKYLEAMKHMEELNLDVAGEFLLMSASLIQIKSKMLLPKEEQEPQAELEADPRAELVRSLLEYQRYKEAAEHLKHKNTLGSEVFVRQETDEPWMQALEQMDTPVEATPIFDLLELFAKTIKKYKPESLHEVQKEGILLRARIRDLMEYSLACVQYSFLDALLHFKATQKGEIIVTFLSLLEMAKMRLLTIEHPDRDHIYLKAHVEQLQDSEALLAEFLEDEVSP